MAGKVTTQLVIDGKNNSKKAFDDVKKDIASLDAAASKAGKAIAGYFTFTALTSSIKGVARMSDGWVEMTDRLKNATRSQAEFEESMTRLRDISNRTFTSMANNSEIFIRSLSPLREKGFTNSEILDFTEAIGLGLVASAAKGEKAEQVINQVGKAMQTGVLRGEAFNAVVEQTPALADALAKGLGKTREQLAKMAADGKLTTDVVIPALNSQLGELGTAVDDMNVTVGDALVRLQNAWNEAIGSADVSPLVDSIEELTKTISDPQIVENMVTLASALAKIAALAIEAGAGFVRAGEQIGYLMAQVAGNVDELTKAEKQIEFFKAALDGFTLNSLLYSEEELKQNIKAWEDYRDKLLEQQSGMSKEARDIAEKAEKEKQEIDKKFKEESLAAGWKWAADMQAVNDQVLKAAERSLKAQQDAERKANSVIKKLKDERVGIEKKYAETIAQLNSADAGGGAPSYAAAQALKVAARNAVQAGDFEAAAKNAEAARQMLLDLKAAGENTYGFAGFAKELQQIELAANDLEQSRADEKLKNIQLNIAVLKDQVSELKDVKVTPTLDEAAASQLTSRLQSMANSLGETLTIPVRVVPVMDGAATIGNADSIPAHATGTNSAAPGLAWVGERGPELVAFGGGERVFTAAASQNLASRLAGLQMPEVGSAALTEAALSVPGNQQGKDLGRVALDIGGQSIELLAERPTFEQVVRLNRHKFGRTTRRS
ncbi:tape measure protein [Aquipseudomonas campi]